VPGEQPARQHAVGGDADAELAARGQDRRLDAAREQRVLDLQVADRANRRSTPQRFDAHLGEADVAHVAGVDHLAERADGLLDGHRWVESRRAVDVEVIGAEPAQAVARKFQAALGRLSKPTHRPSPACRRPECTKRPYLILRRAAPRRAAAAARRAAAPRHPRATAPTRAAPAAAALPAVSYLSLI
jgi:hypothetical protein